MFDARRRATIVEARAGATSRARLAIAPCTTRIERKSAAGNLCSPCPDLGSEPNSVGRGGPRQSSGRTRLCRTLQRPESRTLRRRRCRALNDDASDPTDHPGIGSGCRLRRRCGVAPVAAGPETRSGSGLAQRRRLGQRDALRPRPDRSEDRRLVSPIRMGSGLPSQAITAFAIANQSWPDPELFRKRAEQALEKNPSADDVILPPAFRAPSPIPIAAASCWRARSPRAQVGRRAMGAVRLSRRQAHRRRAAGARERFGLLGDGDYKARFDMALLKGPCRRRHAGGARKLRGATRPSPRPVAVEKQGNADRSSTRCGRSAPIRLYLRPRPIRPPHRALAGSGGMVDQAPKDPVSSAVPTEWWEEKRIVSRKLLDLGDARPPQRWCSAHRLDAGQSRPRPISRRLVRCASSRIRTRRVFRGGGGGQLKPVTRARALYWMEPGGGGRRRRLVVGLLPQRRGRFRLHLLRSRWPAPSSARAISGIDRSIPVTSADRAAMEQRPFRGAAPLRRQDRPQGSRHHLHTPAETLRTPGQIRDPHRHDEAGAG